MTCIVGVTHDDGVIIGGDSAGVGHGYDVDLRADEKVFKNGPYIMGFTSSFRMGDLLRHQLDPPQPYGDIRRFLTRDFIDAVRHTLDEGGWQQSDNGQDQGGTFLVGVRGQLFTIYNDYQVSKSRRDYAAVGCGRRYAVGNLYTTDGMAPDERIKLALESAAEHSGGVARPFELVYSSDEN